MNQKTDIIKLYLNSEINEQELITQLDKLQSKSIKNNGVIYTPWFIVEKMIQISQPDPSMTIIEPSCGHGVFLIGLLEFMRNQHQIRGYDLFNWFTHKVTAVDIVDSTIQETKEIIALYFQKHFNITLPPSSFNNLISTDSLFYNWNFSFDLCIGNPPYVRTKNIQSNYLISLREKFYSCEKGNIDLYYAFVEKFQSISKKLCFIIPNGFLKNTSGKKLLDTIKPNISLLLDFKEQLVFEDARTYTCIIQTSDKKSSTMLYANSLTEPYKTVLKNSILSNSYTDSGILPSILSGIATLRDSAYLVRKEGDTFYCVYENKKFLIEKDILAPYIKITKQKNNNFENINYMIFPYDQNKKIIPENTLKQRFPLTYKYLLAIKQELLLRDRGKTDKYEAWYAYGRKQGLHTIESDTVILIPKMIGGSCQPQEVNIKQLLSEFGQIVFTSGFVVPNYSENKAAYHYLLSPDFMEFAKKNGKAWPGKSDTYYSLTVKQIKSLTPTFI